MSRDLEGRRWADALDFAVSDITKRFLARDCFHRLALNLGRQFLTGGQPACYTLDLPRSFGRFSRSAQDPRAVAFGEAMPNHCDGREDRAKFAQPH